MLPKNIFLNEVKLVAEKAAKEIDASILSVTFNSTPDGKVLKVVVDAKSVNLDTCEHVSRQVSAWTDEHEGEIPGGEYSLEVSSPGLERPLKNKHDYDKLIGKLIYIETKTKADDGRKRYTGLLKRVDKDGVSIYVKKESAEFSIAFDNIGKARAEYDFLED